MRKIKLVLALAVLIVVSFIIPLLTFSFDIPTILTLVSLVFVILIGFFFAAATANYQRLQTLISDMNSGFVSIFSFARVISPNSCQALEEAIDNYMVASLDFSLLDHSLETELEFNKICEEIDKINHVDEKGNALMSSLHEKKEVVRQTINELSLVSKPIVGAEHWIVITIFAAIIAILMLALRDGTLVSSFITSTVLVSIYLVLDLLYAVDTNRFLANKLAFQTPQIVFKGIGRLPYYPTYAIKSGDVRILPKSYRVGRKDSAGKRIIEVVS